MNRRTHRSSSGDRDRLGGPATEAGGAALLTTGIGLLLTAAMCLVLPAATGVALTGVRARWAADAVALAVLAGSPLAGPVTSGPPAGPAAAQPSASIGTAVADRVALANGAVLVDLDVSGWPTAVTATVEVAPPAALGGVVPAARASATAHLEPP